MSFQSYKTISTNTAEPPTCSKCGNPPKNPYSDTLECSCGHKWLRNDVIRCPICKQVPIMSSDGIPTTHTCRGGHRFTQ